jgi:hypothetical protein
MKKDQNQGTEEIKETVPQVAETKKPAVDLKPYKQDNSAMNSMLTHLKAQGFKVVAKTSKIEEFDHITSIEGDSKSGNKFRIELSKDLREDTGRKQVILLLNVVENDYITLKPMTNGQIVFYLDQFVPGITTITQVEESK